MPNKPDGHDDTYSRLHEIRAEANEAWRREQEEHAKDVRITKLEARVTEFETLITLYVQEVQGLHALLALYKRELQNLYLEISKK